MNLRVIVIGGGIGGLALAQGLRRGGVEVAVYERDRSSSDRLQGYRVHINEAGSRALHACLPPEIFYAFLAICGQPNTSRTSMALRLALSIWALSCVFFELLGPFNLLGEPAGLLALELSYWAIMAFTAAAVIVAILRRSRGSETAVPSR